MSIHNVTPSTFDHLCNGNNEGVPCHHQRTGVTHDQIALRTTRRGQQVMIIICPDGHEEHCNNELSAAEETSPTRDEASREQVRNVRLLLKYKGLPVKG